MSITRRFFMQCNVQPSHSRPLPRRCPMPPQRGALPGHWPHVTLALGQGFNLTAFALSLLLVRLLRLAEVQ